MSATKFQIVTGPIREGATAVHIYNDGLTVLLYDDAHEARIRQANPRIIWYSNRAALNDPTTTSLLEAGDLLVYGLHGDGGIDIEIVVGEPLTAAELSTGKWFAPESGYLTSPSGKLWIHSYNTLPMGDNGDHPTDPGALVIVPPDAYRLTLYRKDWDAMESADIVTLNQAEKAGIDVYGEGRIDEVIVLSPVGNAPISCANTLFRYCLE
ncbi:MAG: hypothetical protein HY231_26935 [Acidobacteria bacterium]|nr:hypothetical protein [Acidobacteriota bacterium]